MLRYAPFFPKISLFSSHAKCSTKSPKGASLAYLAQILSTTLILDHQCFWGTLSHLNGWGSGIWNGVDHLEPWSPHTCHNRHYIMHHLRLPLMITFAPLKSGPDKRAHSQGTRSEGSTQSRDAQIMENLYYSSSIVTLIIIE